MAQLEKVSHDYLRYANCWEDADLLLEALSIQKGDRILSIASAGDNSFSLLTGQPELVVAIDINPMQLKLVELKKAAIKCLEHTEYLEFFGFKRCDDRKEYFRKVQEELNEESKEYWILNEKWIESGLVDQGKFERYFQHFHKKILPLIHSKSRIHKLFEKKSREEQRTFYENKWNNLRWEYLFRIFFSKQVMGWLGRDPQFLKEVEVNVSDFILSQARSHLGDVHCQDNYFLHYILTGEFGPGLPHYARKENYNTIRDNIDALVIKQGFAEDAGKEFISFNKFNLSNIFEYMDKTTFKTVGRSLIDMSTSDSRYAYWNLMVKRKLTDEFDELSHRGELSALLTKKDKGFFYMGLNVDVKK